MIVVKELSFATNLNFVITISLQSDGVDLRYFKLRLIKKILFEISNDSISIKFRNRKVKKIIFINDTRYFYPVICFCDMRFLSKTTF